MAKTKSRKIEGLAKIEYKGSGCVGCMAWETPFILLDFIGEELCWWVDRVNDKHCGTYLKEGQYIWLRAFIRQSTGRLFNVKISQVIEAYNR
jgi:hypothetical protein